MYRTFNFGFITVLAPAVLLMSLPVRAQDIPRAQTTPQVATTGGTKTTPATATKPRASIPAYDSLTGIRLGMNSDEVRKALGNLKTKGERQDFFEFSDVKSAQVFYDGNGKAVAISFDYVGSTSSPPTAEQVLGEAAQAKPDGSVYAMKRYPEAGFWIAYSRTAGENPITSVTVQKI